MYALTLEQELPRDNVRRIAREKVARGPVPLGRMLREAKVTQIFEGTNQIQRPVISRHL